MNTLVKPKLAVFPKCFMDQLCVDRTMTLFEWIELAATLDVEGLEFYSGFVEDDDNFLDRVKAALERHKLAMPMFCCSPDFTQLDPLLLQKEIDLEKRMIEITSFFGGRFCRVLSGQRRPGLTRENGIAQVVRVFRDLLPFAEQHGVVLTMENHYKDNYWQYPEFAQKSDVFVEIVEQIDSPWFGVNFDPSNTILAGEDPLVLLERVKHRVVTMHASDRYLKSGTIEDLRKEEDSVGYASRLSHGVIGKGMNDYDTIFSTLHAVGFRSWISIEDGLGGMDELRESVHFLKAKIDRHFRN
ncbi:MAG TPA: sugar phosphate isomerase/epimerase family protein [Acidobacteriaceae bacterium]|nr:sugar phosphate isomerase/epimerase family protein [Acidobacteriaceae bacterium]